MASQQLDKHKKSLITKMLNNIMANLNNIKTMLSLVVNEMEQLVEEIKKQKKD